MVFTRSRQFVLDHTPLSRGGGLRGGGAGGRAARRDDLEQLRAFVRSRRGVEAYLEPRTVVTQTTVVLVASDGEWTRKRVADPRAAARFAKDSAIPLYDAETVGYPQRMREWTARQGPNARPHRG